MRKNILVLGGTAEARQLATHLEKDRRFHVITSLAGRTDNPLLPDGKTRIGGFDGVDGLTDYLKAQAIDLMIDATHPFAARISTNATQAASQAGCEIIRLERPPWQAEEGDQWHHVSSLEEAITTLPVDATVFVTIGRQQLGAFLDRQDIRVVARAIEKPQIEIPDHWTVLLARPPFSLDDEISLFEIHNIDVLVTKNAGGTETHDKLVAARTLGKPVIVIDRLPKPVVPSYRDVSSLLASLN